MATRFRLHEGRGTDPDPMAVIDDSLIQRPRVHIAPGRQIPGTRYRAIRWLGEGGMGVVYEAEHLDIGRRVAVKILRHHYSDDHDAMELFRQEARATAQVGSENILQVHDFAQLPDGRLMMAMELLEGHDLMAEMGNPLELGRVISIGRQCCKALAAAHDAGLVHRDIKPENIFLLDSGERLGKVKIVDFGIAVVLSGDKTKRKLVGTPQYIAPEAISSHEIAPALDQYALGVVLYEMLTGTIAFEADTVAAMIQAQLHEMPYPPSQVQQSVHPAFDAVVMRCLSKDPKERFQDMRDLEAALCEVQINAGIITPWDDLPLPDVAPERKSWLFENMPSPRSRPATPQKRSSLAIALSIAGALVIGGAVVGGVMWNRAQQTAPELTVVDQMTAQAREAASRGLWLYPPLDKPEEPTAFIILSDLAELDEDGAAEAAEELRTEFATSLYNLGETYWTRGDEGSKLVAQEFYKQAKAFDEAVEIPEDRSIDEREVLALRRRAEVGGFSDEELIEKQPLAAAASGVKDEAKVETLEKSLQAQQRKERQRKRMLKAVTEANPQVMVVAKKGGSNPLITKLERPDFDSQIDRDGSAPNPESAGDDAEDAESEEPDEIEAEDDETKSGTSRSSSDGPEPTVREKRDPKKARGLAQQGMAAYKGGNSSKAILLFEQALAKNPSDKLALQGIRDTYFDKGDYGRATRYGRRVVQLSPKNASHRIRLGDSYFKVGRNLQAEKEYQKALELGDARARERLNVVRRKLGK